MTIGETGGSGAAKYSKCSEASAAIFMQCRNVAREKFKCEDACFEEPRSGIKRSINPYAAREPLPLGNPALKNAIIAHRHAVREDGVNNVGYRLLDQGRVADAIVVFRWNAENFRDSANVYDSLGEAYLKAGDVASAMRNYERALRLDPKKATAKSALERLKQEGRESLSTRRQERPK